jgi:hypothetical protein
MTEPADLHAVCHRNIDVQRSEFNAELARIRLAGGADRIIAARIRGLLLPGVGRKTVRVDELRQIVDHAERIITQPELWGTT